LTLSAIAYKLSAKEEEMPSSLKRKRMRILILGGDGYLGWPTAMYFSMRGHDVAVMDNFLKRQWELELGTKPLVPVLPLHERIDLWKQTTGKDIKLYVGDLRNFRAVEKAFGEFKPEAIVHYGEQPSAPFSMIGVQYATLTQHNNIIGTLHVLFAMKKYVPDAHLIKLGTMGEYGTPNIDIEEGYLDVEYKGRKDRMLFPKKPGSFYHLTKVHDSHNIFFTCNVWGLRATDLNQGVVYGIETEESKLAPGLDTSFHYDEIFGTALNRFCVQAAVGTPLTVYGKGGQTRGYLNIVDTLQCVELAAKNPPQAGEFRVFNQFTETFSVLELAELVKAAGEKLGLGVSVSHVENPRKEMEEHYYNPVHTKLLELGLKPHYLSDVLLDSMMKRVLEHKNSVNRRVIMPKVKWSQDHK
jgi:UDP-sulfoquinovose synthase